MIIFYIPFFAVSIYLIWKAVETIRTGRRIKKNGIMTTGYVASVTEFEGIDLEREKFIGYKLAIKFQTLEGDFVEIEAIKTENYYCVGLEIPVFYESNNPQQCLVNERNEYIAESVFLFLIALGIVLFAFWHWKLW